MLSAYSRGTIDDSSCSDQWIPSAQVGFGALERCVIKRRAARDTTIDYHNYKL